MREAGFQASLKGESSSQMPQNYIVKLHSTAWKLGGKIGAAPEVWEGWDKSQMLQGQPDQGGFRGRPGLARPPPGFLPKAAVRDSNSSGSGRGRAE